MMKHFHYTTLASTQDLMKEKYHSFAQDEYVLISADQQSKGYGRHNKPWDNTPEGLFLSLKLPPAFPITLTALEIAILVTDFFKSNDHLTLKWPNDIWNDQQKKCGGILIDIKEGALLVGMGINISAKKTTGPWGTVYYPQSFSKKELSLDLAHFIQANRLPTHHIAPRWKELCLHMDKEVQIEQTTGLFTGVGENGQALIMTKDGVQEFYSGSLKVVS